MKKYSSLLDPKKIKETLKKAGELAHQKADTAYMRATNLKHNHRVIAYMAAHGHTRGDIAEAMGFNPNHITNLMGRPEMKEVIAHLQEKIFIKDPRNAFRRIFPEAVETARDIMKDKKNKAGVRHKAAADFMNRHAGMPIQKVETESTNLSILIEKIDRTTKIIESKESSKDNEENPVIDVDPVDSGDSKEQDMENLSAWVDRTL